MAGRDDWDDDVDPRTRLPEPPPDVELDVEVRDWLHRGLDLLDAGSSEAAVALLGRAAAAEPRSRQVREALARAQFDAGRYAEARETFAWITTANPSDDYAQFGWGLAAAQEGDMEEAVEHLALAASMRPDVIHYNTALRGARAALADSG